MTATTTGRLRWHLHEVFPGLEVAPRSLGRLQVIAALDQRLRPVDGAVAAIARELLARIRELTTRSNQLQREITRLVRPLAPTLLALPGCGPLTAAKLLGRWRARRAFGPGRQLPGGTAPRPSRCGRATTPGIGCTAAATAR